MSKSKLTQWLNKNNGETLVCQRSTCGKPIRLGQKVVSRISGHHTKLYHQDCWEEMFIEVK